MEETQLVKMAKRGDADAFGILYEKVYRKLYQYAFYTLRSEQDAEDAVSETVADAFEQIRTLKKDEAFFGWISRILANKCRQKLREYYRPEDSLEEAAELTREADLSTEDAMDIRESFFALNPEDRTILSMHIFFGYKTREIAEQLQMNENTVRSRESRALKKLGSRLK